MSHCFNINAPYPFRPKRAMRALRRLLKDQEDTRQVFEIMRALTGKSLIRPLRRFRTSEAGRRVLLEKREIIDVLKNRDVLARMPATSLGGAYLRFLETENISPEGLVKASFARDDSRDPDADDALYARHLRDIHDLWHVLTGYGRDGLGEICVVAFSYAQTRNSGYAAIALVGSFDLMRRFSWRRVLFPAWEAYQNGRKAIWLPGEDIEACLTSDLQELRKRFGVDEPTRYIGAKDVIRATTPIERGATKRNQARLFEWIER